MNDIQNDVIDTVNKQFKKLMQTTISGGVVSGDVELDEEGNIQGGPGSILYSKGLYLIDSAGETTVALDSESGSAFFKGEIIVTGGDAFSKTNDTLDDISDGTTYKKTTSDEKTGAGRAYNALDSDNALTTKVLPGSNVGTPSGSGLFLGADYLGYYSGSEWKVFIDNSGKFTFKGDSDNYISWNGSSFIVKGNIYNTGGEINADYITTGTLTGRTVRTAASGARVQLDSTNYLQCIDSNGYTRVKLDTTSIAFRDSNNVFVGSLEGLHEGADTGLAAKANSFWIRPDNGEDGGILFMMFDSGGGYNGNAGLQTTNDGTFIIWNFGGQDIEIYPSGSLRILGDLTPTSGGVGYAQCGTSSYYWADVYATDGNFNHLKTRGGTEWLDTSQTDPRLKQNLICYTDEGKNLGDEDHKFASVFQRYVRAHEIRDIPGNLIADLSNQKMDLYKPLVLNSRSSYPSSPDTGEMFFHTILGKIVVYNGSQWETVSSSV